jgi:HKD family nuclease
MKMKPILTKLKRIGASILLPLIFLFLISPPVNAQDGYAAEVKDISGREYYPAAKEALQEAKESIYMVMYQVSLRPYDKTTKVYKLIEELIRAKERGVKLKVILDQNIDFVTGQYVYKWAAKGKNAWCFKALKEAGIDVKYDDLTTYTHAKAIVIDNEIVIMGSSNWSESAFTRNAETNVLIKSKGLASELLKYFKTINIDKKATSTTPAQEDGVFVSWQFLENPNLAGRMLTRQSERTFGLYLLLLREFDNNPEGKIILNYDKIAASLGLYDTMTRTDYRRQIIKSLRKLEQDYKLIKFEPEYNKDATITLLSYNNPEKSYSMPKGWYFQIPDNYWEYGWSRQLSHRAKFCYLINLAYVNISNAKPWWFSSLDVLAKRFNISKEVISKGMGELRSLNLIDATYDTPKKGSYKTLLAKSYKVLPLYDPEWLEAEWDRLELSYSAKRLNKAKEYAKIVFKENDPIVVEEIITLMDSLGEEQVKKAFAIVGKKSVSNSKRCYAYVKGILKNWQE